MPCYSVLVEQTVTHRSLGYSDALRPLLARVMASSKREALDKAILCALRHRKESYPPAAYRSDFLATVQSKA